MAATITPGHWAIRPYGLRWESGDYVSTPITQDTLGIRDRVLAGLAMSELTVALEFHARAQTKYRYEDAPSGPSDGSRRLVAYHRHTDQAIATVQGSDTNGWRHYVHRPHGRWSDLFETMIEAVDAAVMVRAYPLEGAD